MKIINNSNEIISHQTCVALGNFDGVHLGHRKIISSALECAKMNNCLSCVYTFSSHPSVQLGKNQKVLTSTHEKVDIFSSLGCDLVYLEDFNSVRYMEPGNFCKKILKEKLNAKFVFCGDNYTFGHKGKGSTETLREELSELGINPIVVPYVMMENGTVISSTFIRNQIALGKAYEASKLMNAHYKINGQVIYGKQLGHKLGFPTLNINIPEEKVLPAFGVYASYCLLNGILYQGISNIGIRPTTDAGTVTESTINCETYLFDFSGNAYDKYITVYLCSKIRDEMRFNLVSDLTEQISKDVSFAKSLFEENDFYTLCR